MIKLLGSFRDFMFNVERSMPSDVESVIEESGEHIFEDIKEKAMHEIKQIKEKATQTIRNFKTNATKYAQQIENDLDGFLTAHPEILLDATVMVLVLGMVMSAGSLVLNDHYLSDTIGPFRIAIKRELQEKGITPSETQLDDMVELYKRGYFREDITPIYYYMNTYK